jgi:hypothetical protein
MLTIALLPVDGRPVTRELPVQLGAVAGVTVLTPPPELLGFWKQPGDRGALRDWLAEAAAKADAVIVSGDMLAYGGLVPSRILPISTEDAMASLAVLRTIRAAAPAKPLYLFSTVMRISNADSDIEEPPYWAEYGRRFWRWSYETERGDAAAAAKLAAEIPEALRNEYLAVRESRFRVNQSLLTWVKEGVLDLLLFPQDDCAQHGFHVAERNRLMSEAAAMGLGARVLAYPGADEVASALVARAVHHLRGTCPRIFPFYSRKTGPDARTMYEDVPLHQTVAAHIQAAGCQLARSKADSDLLLAVHAPAHEQGDWYLRERLQGSPVDAATLGRFVHRIRREVAAGRAVAVADLCYANGADPAFMAKLLARVPVSRLAAFSAWNTAGNTLGTAVAMASLWAVHGAPAYEAAHAGLLMTRFCDDYLYQSLVRPPYAEARDLGQPELAARCLRPMTEAIQRFHCDHFSSYQLELKSLTWPWRRAFEIRVDLQLRPTAKDFE